MAFSISWLALSIPFCFAICSILPYCSAVKQIGIERSFILSLEFYDFISFLLIFSDRLDPKFLYYSLKTYVR